MTFIKPCTRKHNNEMNDNDDQCFTNRFFKLVNCLNGFTDLVKISNDDEQITKKRKLEH